MFLIIHYCVFVPKEDNLSKQMSARFRVMVNELIWLLSNEFDPHWAARNCVLASKEGNLSEQMSARLRVMVNELTWLSTTNE